MSIKSNAGQCGEIASHENRGWRRDQQQDRKIPHVKNEKDASRLVASRAIPSVATYTETFQNLIRLYIYIMGIKKILLAVTGVAIVLIFAVVFFGVRLIEFGATLGSKYAQNDAGVFYDQGAIVDKDDEKAIYWYTKSAEQGFAKAQYNLGVLLHVKKNYKTSIKWLKIAALQNYAPAQRYLGQIYIDQKNPLHDSFEGIRWYTLAAKNGDVEAQYFLGAIYLVGKFTSRDLNLAVYWITQAANQGLPKAQASLGHLYSKGEGVGMNIDKGIEWFQKAVNGGDSNSQRFLDDLMLRKKWGG